MGLDVDLELDSIIVDNYYDLQDLLEKSEPRNSEIRNASSILRRFLIHGDLNKSAISRDIKLSFFIPDISSLKKAIDLGLLKFWQNGDTTIFGVRILALSLTQGPNDLIDVYYNDFDPTKKVKVKLNEFKDSPVASLNREIVTREAMIKYVANKTGSSHYDKDREDFSVITKIRGMSRISLEDDTPSIGFNVNKKNKVPDLFVFKKNQIDPLLIEILSTSKYIVESPTVKYLIKKIESDI